MRGRGFLEGVSNAQTRFLGEGAFANVKGEAPATGPSTPNSATAKRIWIAAKVLTLVMMIYWFSKTKSVIKSSNRVALIRISHLAAEATSTQVRLFRGYAWLLGQVKGSLVAW